MTFSVINPATNEIYGEYDEFSPNKIQKILLNTHNRFTEWSKTSFSTRSKLMNNSAKVIRENIDTYSALITTEMGKPIAQSESELLKCAWVCEYYAENAEKFLRNQHIATEANYSFVANNPIGSILAIMPWNFPFWQVFRFAAPALMAGNVGLLKHSRNTMGCAVAIEEIFLNAGFPENCFSNLVISAKPIESIIADRTVAAVTLTGSTPVGAEVASIAGKYLKKSVLELGGSDPYIILADADIDQAVIACAESRLLNSGQSCIAAKRFIAEESIYDEFTNKLVNYFGTKKMGNPFDRSNSIGPQARKDLQLDSDRQVRKSISMGAELKFGSDIESHLNATGFYFPPCILTEVQKGMPAYDEELFGPVAPIISAKNEEQAIEIANDSRFGLGAAIFTKDIEKGKYYAENKINAGACFVNDFVKSDPRLPFGGIKESGYGRELAEFGIREFVNIKTVVVK